MSSYFYSGHHHPPSQHQSHHTSNPHPLAVNNGPNHSHGRSRRAMRMASAQASTRQLRQQQQQQQHHQQQQQQLQQQQQQKLMMMTTRESLNSESSSVAAFRLRFEAGRSFDLDDDLEFCPVNLLTFDERQSVASGSSDRSSLGSTSPEASPLQMQIQPQITGSASMPPPPTTSITAAQSSRLHQPVVLRSKNAIPIVNPSTGNRISSPPSSVSPAMMQPAASIRRW